MADKTKQGVPSLRGKVLAMDDYQEQLVKVPELGGTFQVRTVDGLEQSEIYDHSLTDDGKDFDMVKLGYCQIIGTVFDPETNDRMFDWSDLPALMSKHGKVKAGLFKLKAVAVRLNRWGGDELEELEKN